MIYLIDDKRLRQQKDYAWTDSKIELYRDVLKPIYNLEDLSESSSEIFKESNIVLYHESFIDNSVISSQSAIKRKQLEDFAKINPKFKLVIFSGSKNFRSIISNVAHLPVSVIYQNLKVFIEKYKENDININYLAFGENPEVESFLLEKLEHSLSEIEDNSAVTPNQRNFFVSTSERYIENPIEDGKEISFFGDETDEDMTNFINEHLNQETYDNLFIPLCFGETLSDFNGLRLAAQIRCTESSNRMTRLFIYSFVGHEYLLSNKYFNILKTKNVNLIGFSKKEIEKAALSKVISFETSELSTEIKKLNLEIPTNYLDNHSISNEWAIYRWANAIEAKDDAINKIISRVNQNLYFKYLRTIYPVSQINKLSERQLKIEIKTKQRVLYIDDEADKGWYEILCKILYDINSFEFDYLGDELKMKTKDEVIEFSISKVENMDADIVILDFRLHESDFDNNLNDVTGYKILQKIKELNPGIQVIIFSATNKIWNLLELQKAGADGFILKESPENSVDGNFTQNSIEKLINELSVCLKMCPLKSVYKSISKVKSNLTFNSELEKLISQKLETGFLLLNQSRIENQDYYINHAYLELFQVIEAFLYEVFEEEGNAYVKLNESSTICVRQIISNKITEAITFTKNNKYEIYKNESEIKKNKKPRLNTNFKVSAVLIFKYGNINSSVKNWTDIYTLRNGKAAHFDKQKAEDLITFEEIKQLCDFLIYFTDINNENSANLDKALKEKSLDEMLDIAKSTNPYFKKDDRINKK